MNHEHNPVAVRISKLQNIWSEATEKVPAYNLARWVIHNEDVDFLNGFFKLESSPHGSLEDIFVVLFTPFGSKETFAKMLISDWIDMYKQGIEEQPQAKAWDFAIYRDRLNDLPQGDTGAGLLKEMLHDFSKYASGETRPLVVTLIPRSISENDAYAKWISAFVGRNDFAYAIKFAIVDYAGHNYFDSVQNIENRKVITVAPPNLDMRGAVNELAAMGNPNDPQVQFRTCMMKMGEAAGNNKRQDLDHWGSRLIDAGQRSGDQSMFASAHLIYAGFLMHFPAKEETQLMLEKAEAIAKRAVQQDANHVVILIQIYGYMGALASMHSDHRTALDYFIKQANLSKEHNQLANAISAYKTIIYLCHTHGFAPEYLEHLQDGYLIGLELTDDDLSVTDYSFIAYHYIDANHYKLPNETEALRQRMEQLFGVNWQTDLQQKFDEVEQQK